MQLSRCVSVAFAANGKRDAKAERVEQAFEACGKAARKSGFQPLR